MDFRVVHNTASSSQGLRPLHHHLTSELVDIPVDGEDGEHVGGLLTGDHRGTEERQGPPRRPLATAGLIQEVEEVTPLLVQHKVPAGEEARGRDEELVMTGNHRPQRDM